MIHLQRMGELMADDAVDCRFAVCSESERKRHGIGFSAVGTPSGVHVSDCDSFRDMAEYPAVCGNDFFGTGLEIAAKFFPVPG